MSTDDRDQPERQSPYGPAARAEASPTTASDTTAGHAWTPAAVDPTRTPGPTPVAGPDAAAAPGAQMPGYQPPPPPAGYLGVQQAYGQPGPPPFGPGPQGQSGPYAQPLPGYGQITPYSAVTYPSPWAQPRPWDGLAIASISTSGGAILLGFMFGLFFVAAPVGLGLGIWSLVRIRRTGAQGNVLAIVGIVLGAIGTLLCLGVLLLFVVIFGWAWSY